MKKEYNQSVKAQNKYGEFVPAICEPYYLSFGRVKCDCGKIFWNRKRYREHYALEHILGLN